MQDDDIFQSHYIEKSDEIKLHIKTAGDPSQPACVLLHGFPEFWIGWRAVAQRLAEKYYVILPDQRGYNLSSAPMRIGHYSMDKLVADIVDIITWSGKDKVILGGHDWGAAVAWSVVSVHPELIEKCVIVNVPHPITFSKHLKHSKTQRKKSRYMVFFQLPLIPQIVLRMFNFKLLRRTMEQSANPGTFENMVPYTIAWRQSGVTPMINWYRAARRASSITYQEIATPVLIIWGRNDHFLEATMAEQSLKFCQQGEVKYIEDASHWVLHEQPDKIMNLIDEYIGKKT